MKTLWVVLFLCFIVAGLLFAAQEWVTAQIGDREDKMSCICITTDYESALGKNTMHQHRSGGKQLDYVNGKLVEKKRSAVRSNPMTKAAQADIVALLRKARIEDQHGNRRKDIVNFFPRPLRVWIHVIRPKDPEIDGVEQDIDPVNFQPAILDAVENGINVNDSFYMSRTTWSVVKEGEKPRIRITVTQETRDEEIPVRTTVNQFSGCPGCDGNMDHTNDSGT